MAKILVVAESSSVTTALEALFQLDGHQVFAETNPHAALAVLGKDAFDVVLTDHLMRRLRGEELVQATRRQHPKACIVVMTDRGRSSTLDDACQVFEKPVSYEAILRIVAECRKQRGRPNDGGCQVKRADRS